MKTSELKSLLEKCKLLDCIDHEDQIFGTASPKEILEVIQDLEASVKAAKWLMHDNSLRTYDGLTTKLDEAVETLQSIACYDRPEHIDANFWHSIGLEACAITIAKDTQLAREFLEKWKCK